MISGLNIMIILKDSEIKGLKTEILHSSRSVDYEIFQYESKIRQSHSGWTWNNHEKIYFTFLGERHDKNKIKVKGRYSLSD